MNEMIKMARGLVKKGDAFIEKHGTSKFHIEARDLLEASSLKESYDYQALVESAFKKSFNNDQTYSHHQFSDLPLTLARGEDCFIDLYFWRRRPTAIHNHHFSGAFQCLIGNNVDLEFEFIQERKMGKWHALGELKLKRELNLRPGQCESIAPLNKFIHQNHHQSDLTINVCFRTPEMPSQNIANYLYSGLRFEKDRVLLDRVRRLFAFCQMEDFNFNKLEIGLDDALSFLIQSFEMNTSNARILNLEKFLLKKIKNEAGIEMSSLMNLHATKLEEMLNSYD